MTLESESRRILSWRAANVVAVVAVWTALGLLSAAGAAIMLRQLGRPVLWAPLLTDRLADWYTCALFTPLFIWLARRWTLEGRWWLTWLPAWLLISTAVIPLKYVLYRATVTALFPSYQMRPLGEMITVAFVAESMAFWAMIAVIYAIEYYDGLQLRERQAVVLKAELAQARLEALAGQLHPHFLFNTLQGISTLIHRSPDAADRMLSRLSDLLRRTLSSPDRPEVPLAEELDVLAHYVEIQRGRFHDRLVVERRVSPDLERVLVPRFILQPLVENAIEHGIGRRAGSGHISITAEQRDSSLTLTVSDDGPGFEPGADIPLHGIGLSNTRRRLAALYGDAGTVNLSPAAGGGLCVAVTLPFRTAASAS